MNLELVSVSSCTQFDAQVKVPDPKVLALESIFYHESISVLYGIVGEDGVVSLGSISFS